MPIPTRIAIAAALTDFMLPLVISTLCFDALFVSMLGKS
jgi:hypothetical protein